MILRVLGALVLAAGLLLASTSRAQDSSRVWILVASPDLQGSYRHAVMALAPSDGGAVGAFLLNRRSQTRLSQLFPDSIAAKKITEPVNIGGPDGTDVVFAMVRAAEPPTRTALPLGWGLYVVSERYAVVRIMERNPPEARYFAGGVIWDAGELLAEIDAGLWFLVEATPELLLRKETETLWEEIILALDAQEEEPDEAPQRR